jgi:hypothetical protein
VHLFLLFLLAHLNFRNIPDLFSFLSGAAEAMHQNEAISEGLDSVRRSVDANALRAKKKHERFSMLADVYLGDQIRGKCSRFGSVLAEVERLKLYWRLTPHLVVRTAETAATTACPGYEHEVINKRKDPVTSAA